MGVYISIPRAKMGTKASVISTLIMAIIFTIAAVVLVLPAFMPSNTDIVISQDFYVDSTYNGGMGYPYETYVSGELKNNTDHALTNVNISFVLESDDSYSETIRFNIDRLEAGEVYTIATSYNTTSDYWGIDDLTFSHDGCGTTEIDTTDFEDFITGAVLGVMALVMWLTFIISSAKYKKNKGMVDSRIASSQSQVFTNATVGGQNVTMNGSFNTNTQATPVANASRVCPYCGSKVPAGADKCPGCGAKN